MTDTTTQAIPNIFPFLRYRDAAAAIEWLVSAFGFEKREVTLDSDGTVIHAELSLGPGVIMLGTAKADALGAKRPDEVNGADQGVYISLPEVDGHYETAKSNGAEIVYELADTFYGSREYSARDPEGYLWSFGTYYPSLVTRDG